MRKLSKDDFDDYLGDHSFYTNRDKDKFYQRLHQAPRKGHKWFPSLVTVLALFGLLIAGWQVFQGMNQPSATGNHPDAPHIASSKQDIQDYYASFTPGLERAENNGLVSEINKKVALNGDADLYINKIWYNSEHIQLYYSVKLPDGDYRESEVPAITGLYLHGDKEGRYANQNMGGLQSGTPDDRQQGIIYQNRLYLHTELRTIRNQDQKPLTTWNGTITTDMDVAFSGETVTLENVKLPIHYDRKKEDNLAMTLPLKHSMKADKDIDFYLDKMKFGLTKSVLTGHAATENNAILFRLKGNITVGFENDQTLPFSFETEFDPESRFAVRLPAVAKEPKSLTAKMISADFIGDDSYEFTIDVSSYQKQMEDASAPISKKLHQKVGEIKNTAIFLQQLTYGTDGIRAEVMYQPQDPDQQVQLTAATPGSHYSNESKTQAQTITLRNKKGDQGMFAENGTDSDTSFDFVIEKEFIQHSSKITVTVQNAAYRVNINDAVRFPATEK